MDNAFMQTNILPSIRTKDKKQIIASMDVQHILSDDEITQQVIFRRSDFNIIRAVLCREFFFELGGKAQSVPLRSRRRQECLLLLHLIIWY